MHPYSITSGERERVPLFLAGLTFASAWLAASVASHIRLPFWIEVPGTFGIYELLYQLFRVWGWRLPILRFLAAVKTPDLNGTWIGVVQSSFDEHSEAHDVIVTIKQNWTHLNVTLKSPHSESLSLVAAVELTMTSTLTYQYENTPRPGAVNTMHAHRGTAVLRLDADGLELNGHYYSGRDRQNFGSINLKKERDDLAGALSTAAR
jgi:hypothetical protein